MVEEKGNLHQANLQNLDELIKLDGVGPVDNRPSTDKFHNFVQKNK